MTQFFSTGENAVLRTRHTRVKVKSLWILFVVTNMAGKCLKVISKISGLLPLTSLKMFQNHIWFCCHKHGWKVSWHLIKHIQWFHTYQSWNTIWNSGLWLGSLFTLNSRSPSPDMKISSYTCNVHLVLYKCHHDSYVTHMLEWIRGLQRC